MVSDLYYIKAITYMKKTEQGSTQEQLFQEIVPVILTSSWIYSHVIFYTQVYLVAHAGPGVEERTTAATAAAVGGGELSPAANSRLLHVIRAFSDVIAGQFYGHRHADTFRLIYNEGKIQVLNQ